MPTASLTGEGLKKYQRWLAVQRAKGREPSPGEIQSFLQSEIQANISTDQNRQALGLRQQEIDIANRRTKLLQKEIDRQSGADTIRGISELAKAGGAINELTGGAITEGLKGAWDWGKSLFTDTGGQAVTEGAAIGGEFTAGISSDDILSDLMDWSGLF